MSFTRRCQWHITSTSRLDSCFISIFMHSRFTEAGRDGVAVRSVPRVMAMGSGGSIVLAFQGRLQSSDPVKC